MLSINNIKMDLHHTLNDLKVKVSKILKVSVEEFKEFTIIKKSIDARKKDQIKYVYSVNVQINNEKKYLKIKDVSIANEVTYINLISKKSLKNPPVIVGGGPAGLLAGIILAEGGLCPIILEQGKDVKSRLKDVELFFQTGELNETSNVQFGEGGAGTFSDGKLNTGIKDPRIIKVMNEFVDHGAPPEIKYSSKPHIGTDKLRDIVKNLRKKIINLGGEFRFENKFIGFNSEGNSLKSIIVQNKNESYVLNTENLILALGHSARDTAFMLYKSGLVIEPKPFAVGVRIEHNQKFINETQYGKFAEHLPAADYKLSTHLKNGRGVFTFCMCPGGIVVAASSEKNRLATNGMSYYNRDLENANSALLVSVNPSDFNGDSPLSGIDFQRRLEEKAFLLGGKNYKAPAQLVGDFLNDKKTLGFGNVIPSYPLGVVGSDFREVFDGFIVESLKQGILDLDKKLKGFGHYDAVLTGVESRSSSPIFIRRNAESFFSNIKGIYPCGEGAGYAGGIMSAAVDGIKCAEALIKEMNRS